MLTEPQSRKPRRRHRSRAEADQVVAAFEASGLTRQEFCDQNGVALKTLARYLARQRRERAGADGSPRWIAVERAPVGGRDLTIVLANGRRIEVGASFDAEALARLLAALERC